MDKHHGCDYSKSVTRCCLLLPFTFATFATFVSGCATPSTVPAKVSVSIDSIYRERAGVIHQGMTRRQVYAVLPPYRRPVAVPPQLTGCIGVEFYSYHREVHRIDAHRYVEILYRLANRTEYPVSILNRTMKIDLDGLTCLPSVPSAQNRRDVVYRATDVTVSDSEARGCAFHALMCGVYSEILLPTRANRPRSDYRLPDLP